MPIEQDKKLLALCLATYKVESDPSVFARTAKRHGYRLLDHISGEGLRIADACIFESLENYVVCFQGTERGSHEWKHVLNTKHHYITPAHFVHRGFHDILHERTAHQGSVAGFADVIGERLLQHRQMVKKPILFCGHSLGGALACLSIDHFGRKQAYRELVKDTQAIVTFGAPGCGGPEWVNNFNGLTQHMRKTAYADIADSVPFSPPSFTELHHPLPRVYIASRNNAAGQTPPGPMAIIRYFVEVLRKLDQGISSPFLRTPHSLTSYFRNLENRQESPLVAKSTSKFIGFISQLMTSSLAHGLQLVLTRQNDSRVDAVIATQGTSTPSFPAETI